MARVPPPPRNLPPDIATYMGIVAKQLNQEPPMSIFSGASPESNLTGVPGQIAINVGSTSDNSRLWVKGGSSAVASKTGWVQLGTPQSLAAYATLASPVFTGNPRAPTPAAADNDTSIPTTAWVQTELLDYSLAGHVHDAGDVTTGTFAVARIPTLDHTTKLSNVGTNTHAQIDTHIAASNPHSGSAPTASPTFTGTITAATANFSGLLTGSTGIVSGSGGASSKNGLGLTVNQGSSDDECITVQSSDVAHGMTTIADTDTFGLIRKSQAVAGGLSLEGLCDSGGANAVFLGGYLTTGDTTKSTAANGACEARGAKKSGTAITALAADENIMVVTNNGTCRFILDGDGDSHQDVGTAWTNFDVFDDVEVLNLLTAHVTRPDDPLRASFAEGLAKDRGLLERNGLVAFNDDTDGHAFVNMSRLAMLLVGACRQLGARNQDLEDRLAHLEQRLLPA